MAHMTKKKLAERERNNKGRSLAYTSPKAGSWTMGYVSNQERKAVSHAKSWENY